MRFLPEPRRSMGATELIAWTSILGVGLPFVAALVSGSRMPGLSDLTFGVLPFMVFCVSSAGAIWILFGRERGEAIMASLFTLTLVSVCLGTIAALSNIWNNGDSLSVLTPSQSILSLFTLDLTPARFGPLAFLRFFPAVFGFGMVLFFRRSRAPWVKTVAIGLAVYLIQSLALHAMDWFAYGFSFSKIAVLATPLDAYRTLVSAQVLSYWSASQFDRFLMPLGRQAENTILASHAAFLFLLSTISLVVVYVKALPSPGNLLKRLATHDSVLWLLPALLGFSLSLTAQGSRGSLSGAMASCVTIVALVSWVGWWRFRRELENVARDEREHPERPLPSGAVQAHELEQACAVLLVLSLLGTWLLGWSVFLGFIAATAMALLLSKVGANWRDGLVTNAIGTMLLSASLAWAGAASALRETSASDWMVHVLLAAALLVGLSRLLKDLQNTLDDSRVILGIMMVGLLAAGLLAGQTAVWLPVALAAVALIVLSRKPGKWHRYGTYAVEFVLASMVFLALFVPKLLRHW